MNNIKNKVLKEGILDVEKFKELDKIIQTKIIYSILETIYGDDLLIVSDIHVSLILDLINSNKANSVIHLPNNLLCRKSYNEVSFVFDERKEELYEIEITDLVNLPNGKNIEVVNYCDWTNNYATRLSSKEVVLPLHVRNRRLGDKMSIKKMKGTKKIKDIFIDDKIPAANGHPGLLEDRRSPVLMPDGQGNDGHDRREHDQDKS